MANLFLLEQESQSKIVNTTVIGNNRKIIDFGLEECPNQVFRNATDAESYSK